MKIIAITNQKGGVGKTTTATTVAAALAREEYKVLLIDADSQCNSTDTYRAIVDDQATLFDVLVHGAHIKEAIQHTEVGDIIAGDGLLSNAEEKLTELGKEYVLREALEDLKDLDYDFVIIDTPPKLGILLTNALTAANSCIIPITPDRYAVSGLSDIVKTILLVRRYSNPNLKIDGLLFTRVNTKTRLYKETREQIKSVCEQLDTTYFDTVIRNAQAMQEAQKNRKSIFDYDSNCKAAHDYEAFIDEYLIKNCREDEK